MTTITTRSGKGSPLTNDEVDANFTNLNDDKIEASGDSMTGNLSFGDNDKAIFGAGSDLQIYHDGSNSYVTDQGTGSLFLEGTSQIKLSGAAGDYFLGQNNGPAYLYYAGALKFYTTSTGIDVTGTVTADSLTVGDSHTIGNGTGDNLLIQSSSGENITIRAGSTREILLQTDNSSGNAVQIYANNNVAFYEDTGNTPKLTWDASAESLNFADNAKAIFGAGSDLQIYHDGSHSYVKDAGTGNLNIQTDGVGVVIEHTDGTNLAVFNAGDGTASLYHSGNLKLATTSTGIDVTGTVTADGLTVDGATALNNTSAGTTVATLSGQYAGSGDVKLLAFQRNGGAVAGAITYADASTGMEIGTTTSHTLALTTGDTQRLRIGNNGDISFYEDTGTTAKFFWDASAESLGLGSTTPDSGRKLHIEGGDTTVGITLKDTAGTQYGIKNDANLFIIRNDSLGLDRLVIDNSGNVGIGTDSPNSIVDIRENATGGQARLRLFNTDQTNSTAQSALLFMSPDLRANGVEIAAVKENADFSAAAGRDIAITFSPVLNNAATERMRIDASGNVGIGTDSPSETLHIKGGNASTFIDADTGTSYPALKMGGSGTVSFSIDPDLAAPTTNGTLIRTQGGAYPLRFGVNTTERMRLDSSGNLLVGKTAQNNSTTGVELLPSGKLNVTRDGNTTALLNRKTSDGDIVTFAKDGSAVGSIGVSASDNFYIGATSANHTGLSFSDNNIVPMVALSNSDATTDLGASAVRFKDLYLSGGVYLGGTGSANKLDDYEEGEFDAALTCTTSGTITLDSTINRLSYTKIGRQVTIKGRLRISSVSSPTGNIQFTLPFTNSNLTDQAEHAALSVITHDVNFPSDGLSLFAEIGASGTVAVINYMRNNAAWAALQANNLDGSGTEYIYINGTYFTA